MLFSRPIQGLLLQINRASISVDNNDMQYEALETHNKNVIRTMILKNIFLSVFLLALLQPQKKVIYSVLDINICFEIKARLIACQHFFNCHRQSLCFNSLLFYKFDYFI